MELMHNQLVTTIAYPVVRTDCAFFLKLNTLANAYFSDFRTNPLQLEEFDLGAFAPYFLLVIAS